MTSLSDSDVPTLPRGVRLREDPSRSAWVLLAPERALELDDVAAAILGQIDGARRFLDIVAALAALYDAPADQIAGDARPFLEDLMSKGYVATAEAEAP